MAVDEETIAAVLDPDLERTLDRLGLLGKFKRGELRCSFCGDIITWENLHAFFGDSGSIKVGCSKIECIKDLSERIAEIRERAK